MKIIYADMSMEMAKEFLKNCHGINVDVEISLKFGYTAMKNMISGIDLVGSEKVYLTNVPYAVDLLKEEISDDFETFVNSFFILSFNGKLSLAKKLIGMELGRAHSFDRLLVNGGFHYEI